MSNPDTQLSQAARKLRTLLRFGLSGAQMSTARVRGAQRTGPALFSVRRPIPPATHSILFKQNAQ